jgi:hypothetical protein
MIRPCPFAPRWARALRRFAAGRAATVLALFLVGFNTGFLATSGLVTLLAPSLLEGVAGASTFQQQLFGSIGLIQLLLAAAFALALARPDLRVGLWSAATLCLAAQAGLLWSGAIGALLAVHGALLSLWAIGRAPVIAKPSLHGAAGGL